MGMLLRPDAIVKSVTEVTPEFLRALGVRAVMVDLDDTLIASGSELLEPPFRVWLGSLVEAGVPVVILSNGENARVARWSRDLGVRGLALVGKPFRRAFRRGLELLGSDPHDTAMVGDQLFTDVLGANLVGLTSVLVSPLSTGRLPHTRALRHLERRLLRRFNPQDPSHPSSGQVRFSSPFTPFSSDFSTNFSIGFSTGLSTGLGAWVNRDPAARAVYSSYPSCAVTEHQATHAHIAAERRVWPSSR